MHSAKLSEIPLPASVNQRNNLITWLIDSLNLSRHRSQESDMTTTPIHQLLSEHILANPSSSWDAKELANKMGVSSPAMNHHLVRLCESGIMSFSDESKGWRRYFLRGMSIEYGVEFFSNQARQITSKKLEFIEKNWSRVNTKMNLEMNEHDPLSLNLKIVESRPVMDENMSEVTQWMDDLGLLGDRPGKEVNSNSSSEIIFTTLLQRNEPLSVDEAAILCKIDKPKAGRILEKLRPSGIVEKVERTDRLHISIWSAISSQYTRRGAEWLQKKGGFNRYLNDSQQTIILGKLTSNSLRPEDMEDIIGQLSIEESRLLLNLLGGRISHGYRLAGHDFSSLKSRVEQRLERTLDRLKRVGKLLAEE